MMWFDFVGIILGLIGYLLWVDVKGMRKAINIQADIEEEKFGDLSNETKLCVALFEGLYWFLLIIVLFSIAKGAYMVVSEFIR